MKSKAILSFFLSFAIIASLFSMIPTGTVMAEPDNTALTGKSIKTDFSNFDLSGHSDEFTLVEDETADGGKYLSFNNDGGEINYWGPGVGILRLTSTGDSDEMVAIEASTLYRLKLKYRVKNATYSNENCRLVFAVRYLQWKDINTSADADTMIASGKLTNTDGWVEQEFYTTSPETFVDSNGYAGLQIMPAKNSDDTFDTQCWDINPIYTVDIDYVEFERVDYKPQHMSVDFDNDNYSTNLNNHYNMWTLVEDTTDDNKYIKFAGTAGTWDAIYTVVATPSNNGSWDNHESVDLTKYLVVQENVNYRIKFRYKLTGDAEVVIPVRMWASNATASTIWNASSIKSDQYLNITPTENWKEVSFIASVSGFAEGARKNFGLYLYSADNNGKQIDFSIDDIVVDTVSTITLDNGTVLTGAPVAPAQLDSSGNTQTGFEATKAEKVNLPSGKVESYNGYTAVAGDVCWYEDSAKTVLVQAGKEFKPYDEKLYSGVTTTLSDANQVAFCGFDNYSYREGLEGCTGYGTFSQTAEGQGYWISETTSPNKIVSNESYTGSKSLYVTRDNSIIYGSGSGDMVYIANGYELIPGQTYLVSAYIKKDSSNGIVNMNLYGGANVYGNGGVMKVNDAIDLSTLDSGWNRIEFAYTLNDYSSTANRSLAFTITSNDEVSFYLDTVVISAINVNAAINKIDSTNDFAFSAEYIGGSTVTLAGREYDVIGRNVIGSLEQDAKNISWDSDEKAENLGVFEIVTKTTDFEDCISYDETTGVRSYGAKLTGFSENDTHEVNIRSYIGLRPVGSTTTDGSDNILFYSVPITFYPANFVGETATLNTYDGTLNFAPYEAGDVNGDRQVTITDFVRMKKYIAQAGTGSVKIVAKVADLDTDNSIGASDLSALSIILLTK